MDSSCKKKEARNIRVKRREESRTSMESVVPKVLTAYLNSPDIRYTL
jgi:hypothetical protein